MYQYFFSEETFFLSFLECHNKIIFINILFSDYTYWSDKVASKLGISMVMLDDVFLEEVATSFSQAAYDIRYLINSKYAKKVMRVNPTVVIQKDQVYGKNHGFLLINSFFF